MSSHADPPPASRRGTWLLPALLGVAAAIVANDLVARAAERRNPARGRFLTIDGTRLHVLERGGGPAVLLLHGNGAMAEDFVVSGLVDRLAGGHRVIVPDRPGFGHSPRPRGRLWTAHAQSELFARALDRLGVERATVVGHSWGVLPALELALNHPGRVSALVLVGGYYHPTLRFDVPLMSLAALPVLGDLLRHTVLPPLGWLLRRRILRLLFAPSPVTPDFAARFPFALSLRPSQLRATANDTATMLPGTAKLAMRYGRIDVPVSIVGGTGDRIVDFETQSRWLHGRLRHSRLHALQGNGHMPHHNEPAMLADIIAQTVRSAAAARAAA
jgi:pimeloyl-ACP methyl ester carboxylesterase